MANTELSTFKLLSVHKSLTTPKSNGEKSQTHRCQTAIEPINQTSAKPGVANPTENKQIQRPKQTKFTIQSEMLYNLLPC